MFFLAVTPGHPACRSFLYSDYSRSKESPLVDMSGSYRDNGQRSAGLCGPPASRSRSLQAVLDDAGCQTSGKTDEQRKDPCRSHWTFYGSDGQRHRSRLTPTPDTNRLGSPCASMDAVVITYEVGCTPRDSGWIWHASERHAPLPPETSHRRLGVCGMLTSTLAASVVCAVAGFVVTAVLQNCRGLWVSLRKARRWLTYRTRRWWTRNWGYIPRWSRSSGWRQVPWWNAGPYWPNPHRPVIQWTGEARGASSDGLCARIERASSLTAGR